MFSRQSPTAYRAHGLGRLGHRVAPHIDDARGGRRPGAGRICHGVGSKSSCAQRSGAVVVGGVRVRTEAADADVTTLDVRLFSVSSNRWRPLPVLLRLSWLLQLRSIWRRHLCPARNRMRCPSDDVIEALWRKRRTRGGRGWQAGRRLERDLGVPERYAGEGREGAEERGRTRERK